MESTTEARVDRHIKRFLVYLLICAILKKFDAVGNLRCAREQSSLINQETSLDCTITGRYYGVYWYIGDSRDSIIRYINGLKAGSEYQNGRLDIASNGSMIINNVRVNDQKTYRVMVVWSEGGDDSAYVHLTVVVPVSRDIPEIDLCNDTSKGCRLCTFQSVSLECIMDGRPPVNLKWFNQTSEVQPENFIRNVSSNTFISISRLKVNMDYLEIKEISCVSSGLAITLPGKIVKNSSVLIISPSNPYASFSKSYCFNDSINSAVIGQSTSNTVAWIKQTANLDYSFTPPTCRVLDWSDHGKLTLHLDDHFEGIYTQVVKNDDGTFSRNVYEVLRAKAPKNSNFVKECLSQDPHHCRIYVNGSGTLTCSVNDARPAGSITWNAPPLGILDISAVSSSSICEHGQCSTSTTISFQFTNVQTEVGELNYIIEGPWNGFPKTFVVQVFNNQYLSASTSQPPLTMESGPSRSQATDTSTPIKFTKPPSTDQPETSTDQPEKTIVNVKVPLMLVMFIVALIAFILYTYRTRLKGIFNQRKKKKFANDMSAPGENECIGSENSGFQLEESRSC